MGDERLAVGGWRYFIGWKKISVKITPTAHRQPLTSYQRMSGCALAVGGWRYFKVDRNVSVNFNADVFVCGKAH